MYIFLNLKYVYIKSEKSYIDPNVDTVKKNFVNISKMIFLNKPLVFLIIIPERFYCYLKINKNKKITYDKNESIILIANAKYFSILFVLNGYNEHYLSH